MSGVADSPNRRIARLALRMGPVLLLVSMLLLVQACSSSDQESNCIGCHQGLEATSVNHSGCVSCHGGDQTAVEKEVAHRAMRGGRNPAVPEFWEESCGGCHPSQLQRVAASLMATNRGILEALLPGGSAEGDGYASRAMEVFGVTGKPLTLRGADQLPGIGNKLYRDICGRCHLGIQSSEANPAHHDAGCAACHFPFNDDETYEGGDVSVHGKRPYSNSHDMDALPGSRTCLRCHKQSGRINLYSLGLNNSYSVQSAVAGEPSISGFGLDVHAEAGLQCIDCHTSREVMGDGYSSPSLRQQIEVSCEDCHGSGFTPPRFATIVNGTELPVRESRAYALQMGPGVDMALTSKGNMFSNVFRREDKIYTLGKRSGKRHEAGIITGTPLHTIVGHERLACYSCHSRSIAEEDGARSTLERGADLFPLALNWRGLIAPVSTDYRRLFSAGEGGAGQGTLGAGFSAAYRHNVGKRAVSCRACHANVALADHSQRSASSWGGAVPVDVIVDSPKEKRALAEAGHVEGFDKGDMDLSRPLDAVEVSRLLAVSRCLACHEKGDDPIYQAPLGYRSDGECPNL